MRIEKIQEFQEIQKEDKKKERKKSGLLTFRVVWVTLKVTTAGDVFHPILHKMNKTLSKTLTEIKSTPSPRHHSPCTPPSPSSLSMHQHVRVHHCLFTSRDKMIHSDENKFIFFT